MRAFLATLDEIEKLDWTFPKPLSLPKREGKGKQGDVGGARTSHRGSGGKEVNLAEATLTTVKVCVGKPKIRPKEVRAIDSDTLRRKLRARGSSLAFLGGGR